MVKRQNLNECSNRRILRNLYRNIRNTCRHLRTAFEQFLSSESPGLMAIADLGEFKFSAIERFRGILHATVKASLRTDPQSIPDWAAARVVEAWNVPTLQ